MINADIVFSRETIYNRIWGMESFGNTSTVPVHINRIRDAIEKKLKEQPENEHLSQQATLIHNAQITTIHSFCLSVIRDHFHATTLDPGFRVGEEGELKLLQQDVLKEVLEEKYQEGEEDFLDFVSAYGGTKK